MSDLLAGGEGNVGRTANGGQRPVPVQGGRERAQSIPVPGHSQRDRGITPPTEIMRRRHERERQKVVAGTGQSGLATGAPHGQPERLRMSSAAPPQAERRDEGYATEPVAVPQPKREEPPDSLHPPSGLDERPPARQRRQTQPQAPTQQTIPPQSSLPHHPPPHTSTTTPAQPRVPRYPAGAEAPQPVGAQAPRPRDPNVSSFPHAFERWEQLSSQWEGQTRYWIRRLENNSDELRNEPLSVGIARQMQDLTAAGANLFHAVVELQRLRASSERKFQRWFTDVRAELERNEEVQAQQQIALDRERRARQEQSAIATRAEEQRINVEKMNGELKRELNIAKEEARRAWEELGRREQEERDRCSDIREGRPVNICGIQIFPTSQIMRQASLRRGQDGEEYSMDAGQEYMEADYIYKEGASPTDTDPFVEAGKRPAPAQGAFAAGVYQPQGLQPYVPGSTPATSGSTAQTIIPGPQPPPTSASSPPVATADAAQPFYSHRDTYLHSGAPSSSSAAATATYPTIPPPSSHQPQRPATGLSSAPSDLLSYVGTTSDDISDASGDEADGATEYVYDEYGRVLVDSHGRPIVERRGLRVSTAEDNSDDEHDGRYGSSSGGAGAGGGAVGTAGPAPPAQDPTTTGPPSSYGRQAGAGAPGPAPDYEGSGYDGWDRVQHHYPTRLSDVPEEEEERSRASGRRSLDI